MLLAGHKHYVISNPLGTAQLMLFHALKLPCNSIRNYTGFAIICSNAFVVLALVCCRLVVPEGYVAQPSTADGGAAPSPHRLALYIYRRPGRESVLQVCW